MLKYIYKGMVGAGVFLAVVSTASAQTNNGYIRETLRRDVSAEADTRIQVQEGEIRAGVKAEARATTTGQATGKRSATSTLKERLEENIRKATTTRETTFATRKEVRFESKEAALAVRDEKRAQIETRIAQKKLVITSEMYTRVAERITHATQRIEDAATRLEDASVKLRTRTDAFAAKGADVSVALTILADVDARIAALKISVTNLSEDGELAATSETPAKAWEAARADFAAVTLEVKEIRKLLSDAVSSLKVAAGSTEVQKSDAEAESEIEATTTTN